MEIFSTGLGMQLLLATMMVSATVSIHLVGLGGLLWVLRRRHSAKHGRARLVRQIGSILIAAFGLFALHMVEIWLYALLFLGLAALPDFESALYFSTTTYTTIGYGDLTLPREWRILGAIEGANGIILLGWSTAFFISVVNSLRLVERQFTDQP